MARRTVPREMSMLGLVQNFFAPRCNPIGVDLGTETLRLAQVQWTGEEYKLIAAASTDVPGHIGNDLPSRFGFFADALHDLLPQGGFRGRQAVLGLPAACMTIQHLRMPKLDEKAMQKAIPWEARGALPYDPSQALLRHMVAGDVYADNEPKSEVIVMAAARETVNQLLAASARGGLDVVGMNVEASALVDCFGHVYRRKTDADAISMFIDIGAAATRAIIARGNTIMFARAIAVGGEDLNRAVAKAMKISVSDAKVLRIRLANVHPALDEHRNRLDVEAPIAAHAEAGSIGTAPSAVAVAEPAPMAQGPDADLVAQAGKVDQACAEAIRQLTNELDLCRRYCEGTFADRQVDRLVFVGGESRQRTLCQQIAQTLGMPAQIGDPLVRMGRISEIGIESGIDRRQPQPTWAIAIGLSMGPVTHKGPWQERETEHRRKDRR
jgi:type IV pilus assembly protein PilM